MEILGLGYLGLEANDPQAWSQYAPSVLGMALGPSDDDTVYLRMDDRHWRIAVYPGKRDRLSFLGWELKDRPSFEAALETLDAAGIPFKLGDNDLEEERGVHTLAQFQGPDGFDHELFYGHSYLPYSFVPGRSMAGFLAGDLGLGHVVLVVPEFTEEIDHFAREVMGFNWFGHGLKKGLLGFYRARLNPRSHNIGYIGRAGYRGIDHIGIEVLELDDVGMAYDLAEAYGVTIQRTMGRHVQDPSISFYHRTPTGLGIEYMWGTAMFPAETFEERRAKQFALWGLKLLDTTPSSHVQPIENA
jgi:2,3-dihydroxybiphenyl 1,2-dioxygenase